MHAGILRLGWPILKRSNWMRRARNFRSEERRVGKEGRLRWAAYQAEDGIRDGTVTGVQTCALPIYPDNPFYNYALGAVLVQEKNSEGAIPHFQKYLQSKPGDARGHFALGVAYFEAFQLDAARKEFQIGRAACRERGEIAVGGVSSRRRHTRWNCDWSSDVCSSDLPR